MADEKLNTGPAENISPEAAEPIATPEQSAASEPQQEQTGPAIPEPGDVVVSFDKINELMAEKRQNARAEVEKAETPEAPEAAAPGETPQPANTEEPKKPRRGRPPKAEKAATENQKAEKSAGARKGRPPKADKAAPDKPKPSKRDKVSRSDGKAPDAKEPIKPAQDTALKETAAVEQTAPEPTTPPRPVEEGKLVYLKLSEVHPFHTFRPHPFKVRDDAKMQEIVASIRVNGVMVPGLARPEKDGNGYEIVAGHRRTHGSELAGLEEMPFIVREMTDHEAVQAMKDSNKQRDGMLPSELAALLELEVEDIKHQGGRLKGVAEGDVGKRSVEIVGEAHEMNYKKVMRYLRLNSLVPELLDKVDDKKMGFMPAVEHYWEEMIRYYSNIVGKYGSPVQRALQKLSGLDIQTICSTHGPVWREYASKAIDIYDRMSRYEGEEGVVIIYGSMYGNTEQMAEAIAASLADNGIKNIVMHNVSKSPSSYILKDVFKYKGVIVGSPTYSNQLFPEVEAVLSKIELREVKNRIFGYFGSFTWAGAAVKRLAAFGEKMKWETVGTPVEQKQGLSATKYEECLALGKEMAGKLKMEN